MRTVIGLLVLFALGGLGIPATGGSARDEVVKPHCQGAGYQGESCACPGGEECEGCPCAECSADEKCECIGLLKEGTGTISGVVKNRWAKRFPMVVYLDRIEGKKFTSLERKPVVDQKSLMFIPRVLPVLVGTTVLFKNNDSVTHNVFSPSGEKYDLGNWDQGETREHTFKKAGVYTQLCKLHSEMVAYIVVVETPYFSTTSTEDGSFTVRNVPPGKYKLRVWGERLKKAQTETSKEVEVTAGQVSKVELKP
jgi:plastocyanin